jgi:ATP-dependent Clp protease ATP-binding subunit ClpA
LLPVSEHAREALGFAHEEARALRHSYIGTEHLFLGLLREHDGAAASALVSVDVTLERVGTEHILLALTRDPSGAAARILLQLDVDPTAIRTAVGGAQA